MRKKEKPSVTIQMIENGYLVLDGGQTYHYLRLLDAWSHVSSTMNTFINNQATEACR